MNDTILNLYNSELAKFNFSQNMKEVASIIKRAKAVKFKTQRLATLLDIAEQRQSNASSYSGKLLTYLSDPIPRGMTPEEFFETKRDSILFRSMIQPIESLNQALVTLRSSITALEQENNTENGVKK